MLRHGDPEGLERIMKSAKTFTILFLNQFHGVPLQLLDPGATNTPTRFYRARPVQ